MASPATNPHQKSKDTMYNSVTTPSNYRVTIALHERRTENFTRRMAKKY